MVLVQKFKKELLDGLEVGLRGGTVAGRNHFAFTLDDETLMGKAKMASEADDVGDFQDAGAFEQQRQQNSRQHLLWMCTYVQKIQEKLYEEYKKQRDISIIYKI